MPPKAAKTKDQKGQQKAEEKKKAKIVEDKTFGLKNKNKSKTVRNYVQNVQKNMLGSQLAEREKKAAEKKEKKEAEKAREAELKAIFRDVDSKDKDKKDDKGPFASSAESDVYLWQPEDFEVEEDDTALEDRLQKELEELRVRLAAEGGGTKVTHESFAAWKEKKRKEAEAAAKKAKDKFKKTGTGLTGRLLYEFDASLFKDDDDAYEEYEYEEEAEAEAEEEDDDDDDDDDDGDEQGNQASSSSSSDSAGNEGEGEDDAKEEAAEE